MFTEKTKSLFFFLSITFSASFIGRIVTAASKEPWYSNLQKSSLTPPGWVFGIVWPLLYVAMALAVWLAYNSAVNNKEHILKLYFIQLAVNASWTPVFFGMHSIIGGMLIIPALLVCIAFLMREYYPQLMTSFYLMVPYFAWCCFALVLNITLYLLN